MPAIARVSCVVTGRVQGVGFRAFVLTHARRLRLTGWVRNDAGGQSVELLAEGHSSNVEQLIREIHRGPSLANVRQVVVTNLDGPVCFKSFEIQY